MTDDALIKQCQNGDSIAFERLLERYYDVIYRIAYHWCKDRHNAQDITQVVCLKLARSINSFSFRSSFTTWLYPLVINHAKDFYKSPNQRNAREQQHDDLESVAGSNSDKSANKIYAQQILEHIGTLQEDLKETLILIYGSGLNHKQAAEKLQVKESTISWRVHEARKILKQTFSSSNLDSEEARGLTWKRKT